MNRRAFLKLFSAAAPAAAIAPSYFFAPIGGWVKSTIVNPLEFLTTEEVLRARCTTYYDPKFIALIRQMLLSQPFGRELDARGLKIDQEAMSHFLYGELPAQLIKTVSTYKI